MWHTYQPPSFRIQGQALDKNHKGDTLSPYFPKNTMNESESVRIPTPPNVPTIEGTEIVIPHKEAPNFESIRPEEHDLTRTSLFPYSSAEEKDELQEWLRSLSEDERKMVTQLGFKFHFVKGILSDPNLIALPGEESAREQIPFAEVVGLMTEIVEDAKEILNEGDKQQDPLIKKLRPFYNYLQSLAEANWGNPNMIMDGHFVEAVKRLPRNLVIAAFPKIPSEKKKELRQEAQKELHLNTEESNQLFRGLELTIQMLQKIQEKNHISSEDLANIFNIFKQFKRFKRAQHQNKSKRPGFEEIEYLINFIPLWVEVLEGIHEQSPNYQRIYLEHHTKALENIFPSKIAPLITIQHRVIREDRLKEYKNLAEIVEKIDDYIIKKLTRRIILQMSSILTYLDYMWEMHQVAVDQHSKRIIYPKEMLLVAPLICREVTKLITALKNAGERLQTKESLTVEDLSELEFSTHEIDKRDDSKPGFRLTVSGITERVSTEVDAMFDNFLKEPSEKETKEPTPEEIAARCFIDMMYILSDALPKAQRTLSQIKAEDTATDPDRTGHVTINYGETLSYHIQDFITMLNSGVIHSIAHLANTFHGGSMKLVRRDIIPEYHQYENQTAELRLSIEQLKEGCAKAKKLFGEIRVTDTRDTNPAPMLMSAKEALRQVADSIRRFQQRRDDEITAGNYYGVLKGRHYDALKKFTETVRDFFLDRECDTMSIRAIATHTLLKDLNEFATKVGNTPQSPDNSVDSAIDRWQKSYSGLAKLQNAVHRGQANGGVKEELKAQYQAQCIEVITNLVNIANNTSEDARHAKFKTFLQTHPFAAEIQPEDFSKELLAFQKVANGFEDFYSALQTDNPHMDPLVDPTLLAEYDQRAAQNMVSNLWKIVRELQSNKPNAHASEQLLDAMQKCLEINTDLEFADPKIAQRVSETLSYLSSFPDYVSTYYAEIKPGDFQTVIESIQYLCGELHNRFRIGD